MALLFQKIISSIRNSVSLHKANIFYYSLTTVLTLIILAIVTRFYAIDWHIPIYYGGDGTFYLFMFKSLINGEWWPFLNTQSQLLSAPYGLNLADFPAPAHNGNTFFVIIKMLGFIIKDYVAVFNVYFLLTFVFASNIFVYVMRKLKVGFLVAIPFGIIFAFLPYHFIRIGHIFLASYFFIPLFVLVLTWMWDESPIFFKNGKLSFLNQRAISTIVILAIAASSGSNYAFFFCFLILLTGIGSYIYHNKNYKYFVSSIILIAVTTIVLAANFIPNIIYQQKYGVNKIPVAHRPEEAEIYGLKLVNIVLPSTEHRIPLFSGPAKEYFSYNQPVEGYNEYLGIVALLGVFVLMFRFFFVRKVFNLYDRYAPLVLGSILLGTIGGVGSLFALLISPMVRGYNRVSIFLATFGLMALALLVQEYRHRFQKKHLVLFLSILTIIAILDQTHSGMRYAPQPIATDFISDKDFVHQIESVVPPDGMIFQLPYVGFVGYYPIVDMGEYSHFSGYLHSNTLKWTYGAVMGRPETEFYEETSKLPADALVERLAIANFAGIYIDRYAYTDRAQALESQLSHILSVQPLVSDTGRLSFFDLSPATEKLKSKYSPAQLEKLRKNIISIPILWEKGFFQIEKSGDQNWRWAMNKGEISLNNDSMEPVAASISMRVASLSDGMWSLKISSSLFNEEVQISSTETEFKKTFLLPPGKTVITFKSNAPDINGHPDNRKLSFRVVNFSLTYDEVDQLK